ncbi:hypothetical protein [Paenibacillus pini]|uniref:Uncharacterized protein n=1 Tax=Paenibacillus pini JCM 16418 TaxID=1236976 RepID=W7YII8_9BACL|nr:hypothetical protein [Paenibacillus pini]GAF10710.1 hypothetical protein JCM16418_4929 [Paenibacillus pini JCM 16418]
MKKIKRDQLLLGMALMQLREQHKLHPSDIIKDYDEVSMSKLWDKHFLSGVPDIEDLKSLARISYRNIIKVKNTE